MFWYLKKNFKLKKQVHSPQLEAYSHEKYLSSAVLDNNINKTNLINHPFYYIFEQSLHKIDNKYTNDPAFHDWSARLKTI